MTREQIDETVPYGFNKRQIRAYIILLEEKDRLVKVSKERVLIEAQINLAEKQEENIDIFLTVKKLFDLENPKHSPIFTEFKTTVKREL
jgi:predicted oxidoreductase (fatty acid repression mutant protein)